MRESMEGKNIKEEVEKQVMERCTVMLQSAKKSKMEFTKEEVYEDLKCNIQYPQSTMNNDPRKSVPKL